MVGGSRWGATLEVGAATVGALLAPSANCVAVSAELGSLTREGRMRSICVGASQLGSRHIGVGFFEREERESWLVERM
jgi:hypothetical protein